MAIGGSPSKKIITYFMNSKGGKLYMKNGDFVEIYNFIVQTFPTWNHLEVKIIDILFRFKI
jgi:hypothetical protein